MKTLYDKISAKINCGHESEWLECRYEGYMYAAGEGGGGWQMRVRARDDGMDMAISNCFGVHSFYYY